MGFLFFLSPLARRPEDYSINGAQKAWQKIHGWSTSPVKEKKKERKGEDKVLYRIGKEASRGPAVTLMDGWFKTLLFVMWV